jgi:DNA repair photolyase
MYNCNPKHLYAMDWATEDPRNVARLERMVRGLGREPSSVEVLRADQLPEVIRENGWIGEVRQGAYANPGDPDFLFSAFTWAAPEDRAALAREELFRRCVDAHTTYGDCKQNYLASRVLAMLGAAPFHHYEQRPKWSSSQVCWSLHDLHSAWGCLHRCAYCQRGSVYAIMLNVEEFLERVDQLLAENPWQKTFRYDVEQDVLAIEPEYGACELLVDDFARREDRYLILFSKSANVDFLLPLEHRGHTTMLWTLTTHSVSRRLEPCTATMEERLEAARKCQEAGYTVRFKFKPLIPIRGWREETTDMLEQLFRQVQPDNLSFEMVFFDTVEEMDAAFGLENLDSEFVEAAWAAQRGPEPWDTSLHGQRPFPFEAKEALYRHFLTEAKRLSPSTPVTLCAETPRMWSALGDLIGQDPWNYVCNCGPHCSPGLRSLETVQGPDAERVAQARALGRLPG